SLKLPLSRVTNGGDDLFTQCREQQLAQPREAERKEQRNQKKIAKHQLRFSFNWKTQRYRKPFFSYEGRTGLRQTAEHHIFLPATRKFPEAQTLIIEYEADRSWKTRLQKDARFVGLQRGRGKRLIGFDRRVDNFMEEVLLEHARARMKRKLLP